MSLPPPPFVTSIVNFRLRRYLACALVLLAWLATPIAWSAGPTLGPVRGKVVFVNVPPGYKSVSLQQRTGIKTRPWKLLGKKTADPAGGMIGFLLKSAVAPRALGVSGERITPETTADGAGTRLFLADPSLQESGGFMTAGGVMAGTVSLNAARADSLTTTGTSDSTTASREVVESDIWRIAGDRLYFFNQLRGLQVFDISDPDDPALLGQFREPNRGEEMYLLPSGYVAMLTRPAYYLSLHVRPMVLTGSSLASPYDPVSGSVVIANAKLGKPMEVARVPYPGYLLQSRLVGKILYVVSQSYDGISEGVQVTSFDLTNPAKPKRVASLALGNAGTTIAATDRFLFVIRSSTDWRRSIIDVVDISAPSGVLVRRSQIETAGTVADKFKLNLAGDILTVVSAVPRTWSSDWNTLKDTHTMVETFSLANAAVPRKLGSLELGLGETVRATRFADGRLYVVTFFTIDPLWVVDLANPEVPTLLGELEVPGFSTYIEPLGDRLVAVGRIDSQTAVSLFDVSNPAAPAVLSQLPLGEGYSSSEANWDEKAFSVIPEHNLILVPYSGYDSGSGWATRVQLIDLGRNGLTKRGIVDKGFAARRTAIVDDRILAISATNLVSIDFANRDQPRVTSDVEIVWRVDRVFLKGRHLLEIGGSADWSVATPPSITVATAANPDHALSVLDLEDVPVTGATVRGTRLYLAQQQPGWWSPIYYGNAADALNGSRPRNPLIVSVFDLSQLPKIKRIGRTEADVDAGYGYGTAQLEAAWPNDDTLVWVRAQWSSWWWLTPMPIAIIDNGVLNADGILRLSSNSVTASQSMSLAQSGSLSLGNVNLLASGATTLARPAASNDSATLASASGANTALAASSLRLIAPWYRTSSGHEMIAFDVSDAAAPKFASRVNVRIGQTGDWSAPLALDGKLYLSYVAYDEGAELKEGEISRRYRHFMKRVDFTDPEEPVVSSEVNVPGKLLAVSRGGTSLLTVGCGFNSVGKPASKRAFHSSTFDGTAATLIDQLETPNAYDPYAIDAGTLLVAPGRTAERQTGQIQAWRIEESGKFSLASEITAPAFSSLGTLHGLLVGFGNGLPHLFDVSVPTSLRDLAGADTSELTSYDLTSADGGAGLGIWQPQGSSGVGVVRLPK